jgi:hypothetical protein
VKAQGKKMTKRFAGSINAQRLPATFYAFSRQKKTQEKPVPQANQKISPAHKEKHLYGEEEKSFNSHTQPSKNRSYCKSLKLSICVSKAPHNNLQTTTGKNF